MSNTNYDINDMRNIILDSQHLLQKSSDSIENIVSDICGLQYDPNPTIHLNQYMMLWNRKKVLDLNSWISRHIRNLRLSKHGRLSRICFLYRVMNIHYIDMQQKVF